MLFGLSYIIKSRSCVGPLRTPPSALRHGITDDFAVFSKNPIFYDCPRFRLERLSAIHCIHWSTLFTPQLGRSHKEPVWPFDNPQRPNLKAIVQDHSGISTKSAFIHEADFNFRD